MNAIVVYESHWGNTARVAEAIAEGIGDGAVALSTGDVTPAVVAAADLVVAGAPVNAFGLPTDDIRRTIATQHTSPPPDLSHPSLRSWLSNLRPAQGSGAAFETRMRWSPGGATGAIDRGLREAGYEPIAKPGKFVVTGTHGPLRAGEIERARAWGAELSAAMRPAPRAAQRV
jgi:flavorubredoxin